MVESEATLSLRSEFPGPPSCKWHFIQLEMWSLSGALAPSCLSEIHYQVGIRLSCGSCAAQAQRIMNNENSMDWRQTQLTGRAAAPAFHSAECDTRSSGWFSTSFTRACSVPGWGGGALGWAADLLLLPPPHAVHPSIKAYIPFTPWAHTHVTSKEPREIT